MLSRFCLLFACKGLATVGQHQENFELFRKHIFKPVIVRSKITTENNLNYININLET